MLYNVYDVDYIIFELNRYSIFWPEIIHLSSFINLSTLQDSSEFIHNMLVLNFVALVYLTITQKMYLDYKQYKDNSMF